VTILRLSTAALFLLACPPASQVARLAGPDGPPVEVGRYPDYVVMLGGDHPLARRAEKLRPDIEGHESILRQMVRDRIETKSPLEFRFMYVGYDSIHQRLIMRYFARHPDPSTIAGWQVQLIYALPRLRLVRAYVQEVPLE